MAIENLIKAGAYLIQPDAIDAIEAHSDSVIVYLRGGGKLILTGDAITALSSQIGYRMPTAPESPTHSYEVG
ncbi:MAG: hypothetical protein LUM44_17880 [Pyrinomonadaceae bacterium]|nr:hypothetical protein [Pyrinomonadaceae bacterium]